MRHRSLSVLAAALLGGMAGFYLARQISPTPEPSWLMEKADPSAPALFFRYAHLNLSQADCEARAAAVLNAHQLPTPNRVINLNNTPFVMGQSSDTSVIIDCSMADATGRVTVMVAHPCGEAIGLEWARTLLEEMATPPEPPLLARPDRFRANLAPQVQVSSAR